MSSITPPTPGATPASITPGSATPGITPAPITDGRITGDLLCAECEYNLRTLALSATCPECGTDVIVSARGDHLASAPAHWRHNLNRGAWWLRLGVILAIPLAYPGIAVSCLGLWLLTRAQPDRDEPALDRGFRLATRWAGVLGGAVIVCLALGALIALATGRQRLFEDWRYNDLPIFDVVWLVAHAVWVLGLLSAWRYLRVLAQRVPDNDLAASFRGLGRVWVWAVLIVAVINGTTFGLIQLKLLPGGSTSTWVAMTLSLIQVVILVSLWVATLRVVTRQAAVLRAVADAG